MLLKKTHIILFLLSVAIITSCGKKEEESTVIPSYVLSKEEYIKLLCDMALSEAASNVNVKLVASHQFDSVYKFDPLKENKITKAKYDSTLAFYSRQPKLFKEMYEEVLSELSKLKSSRAEEKKDTGVKKVE